MSGDWLLIVGAVLLVGSGTYLVGSRKLAGRRGTIWAVHAAMAGAVCVAGFAIALVIQMVGGQ